MAKPLRSSPSVKEREDPRANEYFNNAIAHMLGLVGTTTVDVANINAGAIGTFTVTVTDARPDQQQTVQVAVPSTFNTGLVPWGYVSAKDTVTVVLYNRTGGAIDPPSATYGVRVMP
jgi:hypothetical protein